MGDSRIVVLGLFAILLSSSFTMNPAHASTIESNGTGGGDWNNGSTWSGGVVPTSTDDVLIKSGDVVSIKDSRTIDVGGSLSIENGSELIIDGLSLGVLTNFGEITINGLLTINGGSATLSGKLTSRVGSSIINNGSITLNGNTGIASGSLTTNGILINNNLITSNGSSGSGSGQLQPSNAILINKKTMIFNGGPGDNAGSFQIERNSVIINECDGTITMNGESFRNGRLILFGSLTNGGIITLNGGPGDLSGELSLFSSGTLINHNNIVENPGAGDLSGVINFFGGTFIEDPIPCDVGDIIVADNFGRLLKVSHSGSVTELLTGLTKPSGVAIKPNGNIITTESSGRLLEVPSMGGIFSVISDTGLGQPTSVDIDPDGNFIVVDNAGRLLKVTPGGVVSVIASDDLPRGILDVVVDLNGDFIVTSEGNLLKVTPGGIVSVLTPGLPGLLGVDIDSLGNLWVISEGQLKKITPDGSTVMPITPISGQPFGVAIDFDENTLVTDQTGNLFRVVNDVPILIAKNLGQPVFLEVGPPANNPPICEDALPVQGDTVIPFDSAAVISSSSSTIITNIVASPSHKTVEIILSGLTDVDGDPLTLNIDAITQDEPTSGTNKGDKSPDGFGVGTDTAVIRAERLGTGDGRVYEISFTADDGNGGMCSDSVFVGVPHGKNQEPIDSGQDYVSTEE